MGTQRFTNLAKGALASAITASATSLSLTSGDGALFPPLTTAGDWFMAVLVTAGASASATSEIIQVTARTTDTLTIVRAQEGTTASAWNAGDTCTLVNTAGTQSNFAQPAAVQAQAGNYALDTGTANAYAVTLTPALTAHVVGMPIRWLAGHTSTGNSTFSDGVASAALLLPNGAQLPPRTVLSGGIYESVWNGTTFQLWGISGAQASSFTGTMTGGASTPSGTIQYRIDPSGQLCTLYSAAALNGNYSTSGGAMGLSGLPAACIPAVLQTISCPMLGGASSSLPMAGLATVNNSGGTIAFSLGVVVSGNLVLGNNFPTAAPAGPVGIPAGWSITYALT